MFFLIKVDFAVLKCVFVSSQYANGGTRKIKGKVYFDKEVGAWYLGHYLLSTVLHEQENDNWKKQNNFNFKENQYLRY